MTLDDFPAQQAGLIKRRGGYGWMCRLAGGQHWLNKFSPHLYAENDRPSRWRKAASWLHPAQLTPDMLIAHPPLFNPDSHFGRRK